MMENRSVDNVLANWREGPKRVAREMMDAYGPPDEMSVNMLIWNNNGPWRRTIVRNEEVHHNFPMPHTDKLENVIDYHVPPEKASMLAEFDGSVLISRTRGELSARCESEAMNLLALNLANDIVTGKRSVDDARMEYGKNAMAHMQGQLTPYMSSLQFTAQHDTADPDMPVMKAA